MFPFLQEWDSLTITGDTVCRDAVWFGEDVATFQLTDDSISHPKLQTIRRLVPEYRNFYINRKCNVRSYWHVSQSTGPIIQCVNPSQLTYIFTHYKRLRRSRGSMLAFGTQVRGFAPGRSRRIFRAKKNPQHTFLRRESKVVGPMS